MRMGWVGAAAAGEVIVPGDTGWVLPGTVANHTGSGDTNWSNITNVTNTSSSVASCSITNDHTGTDTSRYLRCTNFDFSAIPDGASLVRFSIRTYMRKTTSPSTSITGYAVTHDGSQDGNVSSSISWTTTLSLNAKTQDYLNNALWGTSVTVSDVKESTFGCFAGGGTSVTASYETVALNIQYVQMKVEWGAP